MNFQIIEIKDNEFQRLSNLVSDKFGIKLPVDKRIMFQSRFQSRLRELGMDSFKAYCDFIFKPENTAAELSKMIDLVSTNKTDFFREKEHFDLIYNRFLPELIDEKKKGVRQLVNCWSAGCSNGQEAFSLAITLEEYKLKTKALVDYQILGTDVSESVLNIARSGIYPFSEIGMIPQEYWKKYVLKSKDQKNPRIKIIQSIQSKIEFKYSNLVDNDYSISRMFHFIFIRNTLIYFDRENQYKILMKVIDRLLPGGYLFIGHSESLINLNLPIRIVSPSVYQKISNEE